MTLRACLGVVNGVYTVYYEIKGCIFSAKCGELISIHWQYDLIFMQTNAELL